MKDGQSIISAALRLATAVVDYLTAKDEAEKNTDQSRSGPLAFRLGAAKRELLDAREEVLRQRTAE